VDASASPAADGVLNPVSSFGLNLFARLAGSSPNVFISPFSISTSLGLAEIGATLGSPTSKAFETVLGRPANSAVSDLHTAGLGDCELLIASSVWSRGALLAEYVEAASKTFDAIACELPSHAEPVNKWVSEKTQGRIEGLVDDDVVRDPLTVALLINAVFFKGSWAKQFDKAKTQSAKFTTSDKGDLQCQMMNMSGLTIQVAEAEAATSIALPYSQDAVRAVLMLPKSQSSDAAEKLALRLSAGGWKELRPTKQAQQKVTVGLPRFKVSFGVADVAPHLKAMGLAEAFGGTGQFLRMSADPDVHIDAVLHKAVLEVSEEGTVASAATAAVMMTRSLPPPEQVVVFDRPFIFAIEHVASEELLFVGLIGSPEFF